MKRAQIDTVVEHQLLHSEYEFLRRSEAWESILQALRHQADAAVASVGGYVDPDVLPIFLEPQVKKHVLIGGDWLLFAARWTVLVPDDFDTQAAARTSEAERR